MVKDRKDWSKRIANNKLNFSKLFNRDVASSISYIHTNFIEAPYVGFSAQYN